MISLRGPKLKVFIAIMGVVCLIAGIYLNFFYSRGFVKTTAVIVDVTEDHTEEGSPIYYPTVRYTVDGQSYTARLDEGSSSYRTGKSIRVLYDPRDPAVAHGASGLSVYVLLLGVVFVVGTAVSTAAEKRSQQRTRELRESRGQTGYAPSEQGGERELYFLTDLGTPKYGHRIEDGARRVLYEAKMTKFTLTQPFGFDFIDHEHGVTTPHLVGHSEESHWDALLIDSHYTFELDGVDVWKHLKENGVSVKTSFDSGNGRLIGMNYRVFRDGAEIAMVESAGRYPHEEDAAAHKAASALPAQGFYRIWTRERNLDLLFTTVLAFARSGASDDRGGSFGAVVGTIMNR